MNITFPFGYVANISTTRIGGDRRVVLDRFDADVPVIDAGDAPVVATWRETERLGGDGEVFANFPYVDMHVRYHDGFFYKMAGRSAERDVVLTADMLPPAGLSKFKGSKDFSLIFPNRSRDDWNVRDAIGSWCEGKWGRLPVEADVLSRSGGDMRGRRTRAEELADGLRVVDGVLYQRVPEPKLVVVLDQDGEAQVFVYLAQANYAGTIAYRELGFGKDDLLIGNLGNADEILASLGERQVRPFARDISVIDGEPFAFDLNRNERWRATGAIVAWGFEHLRTMEPEALAAWGRLRDFSETAEEILTEAYFVEAMEQVDILRNLSDPKDASLKDLLSDLDELCDAAPILGDLAVAS